MKKEIKKEGSKQKPIHRRIYFLGFLMILGLYTGCKYEEMNYAIVWAKAGWLRSSARVFRGKDAIIKSYPPVFLVPPDTIDLFRKRDFSLAFWAFAGEFSEIGRVDNQHIEVSTGVDSIKWTKYSIGDSLPYAKPIRSIYNAKNTNEIIIPAGTLNIKLGSVKGTVHLKYESFGIYLRSDSISYEIKIGIGFTSNDQRVKLANVLDVIVSPNPK